MANVFALSMKLLLAIRFSFRIFFLELLTAVKTIVLQFFIGILCIPLKSHDLARLVSLMVS